MAKYVDVSAASNGDGSFASPYDSLMAVLNGDVGYSVSDNDVVYVRTYNGGNLSESYSGTKTFGLSITDGSILTIIFDDGTEWVGDSGVYKLQKTANGTTAFPNNTRFVATNYNFLLEYTSGVNSTNTELFGNSDLVNVEFKHLGGTSDTLSFKIVNKDFKYLNMYGCKVTPNAIGSGTVGSAGLFLNAQHGTMKFRNLTVDLTHVTSGGGRVFSHELYGKGIDVKGGKVLNSQSDQYLIGLSKDQQSTFSFEGFDVGNLSLHNPDGETLTNLDVDIHAQKCWVTGIPGGKYECGFIAPHAAAEWRDGLNFPTLNATLPDGSNTPWSFKVYPQTVSLEFPFVMPDLIKLYTGAAATKTLTLEFLARSTYGTPTDRDVWMDILYIDDTTGDWKVLQTFGYAGATSLSTSTAGWSSTTYGANSYNKFKISVTTPTSVKQDTEIIVQPHFAIAATTPADFFFVDPDVGVS